MIHPNRVTCPHCLAPPGEPCSVYGGRHRPRLPMKVSEAHPSRVEAALREEGLSENEVEKRAADYLIAAVSRYREQPHCEPAPVIEEASHVG